MMRRAAPAVTLLLASLCAGSCTRATDEVPGAAAALTAAEKARARTAFNAWLAALRAGETRRFAELSASKTARSIARLSAKELADAVGLAREVTPAAISITKTESTGAARLIFAISGERSGRSCDGEASMVKEEGSWRVEKVAWKEGC